MSSADKLKALQLTLDKLEKSYGKGTIMKLGDTAIEPIEVISTGSWVWILLWVWAVCQKAG